MSKKSFKKLNCPFNPQHIVPEDRMIVHIVKCMKNYPNHFTCPYNATHRFLDEVDYKHHILNCPDKKCTVSWKHSIVKNDIPLCLNLPKPEIEENWNDE